MSNDRSLENGQWEKAPIEPMGSSSRLHWLRSCCDILRPAWTRGSRRPMQLRPTAYLDGLRGFAAFLVYLLHHQLWAHDAFNFGRVFESAYGFEDKYFFAALPGIRTFFSGGHWAVTTFFVISGYVLSAKPLALIQSGERLHLVDNIGSALFRRWLRLFLPVAGVSFLWMTSWHVLGVRTTVPAPKSNWFAEVWNWFNEFREFSFIYKTSNMLWFIYHYHAWSIPMEFRGSIIIYSALIAFCRLTRNARLWCEAGLCFYFLYFVDGWSCALFCSGMLICDLDLLATKDELPQWLNRLKPHRTTIFYTMFLVSIYLGGVPSHSSDIHDLRKSPGWYYLSFLKPPSIQNPKWFYLFWGASLLVVCSRRIWWLKSFFETRFIQYLGRISYGFYLVHGPVLWTLGDRLYAAVGIWRPTHEKEIPNWVGLIPLPQFGPVGLEFKFLLPHLILLPVTLWCAEVATRIFDEPSIKFTQWLYRKVLPTSDNP